jgi:hypothetical protein
MSGISASFDRFFSALDRFPVIITHLSSLITKILAHGGYAIGSGRCRGEIESALKVRATPRSPGRQAGEVRV